MFSSLFFKTVAKFMSQMDLYPASGRGFVAVSGGMDSLLLLEVLEELFKKRGLSLHILHVNHQTRPETEMEALFVKNLALKKNILCTVHTLPKEALLGGNIEQKARKERYRFFASMVQKGDRLYTGHHIDDSFEWSLLQSFKSGSLRGSLGIPVKHGFTARPFLTVTKDQIKAEMIKRLLVSFEDSSNSNERFERNYIRCSLTPLIQKRFPRFLKHYVYRSNSLAKKYGVWAGDHSVSLIHQKDSFGSMLFASKKLFVFEDDILEAICKLSTGVRGTLRTQLSKMIGCAEIYQGKSGPFSFSGGVVGLCGSHWVALIGKAVLERYSEYDDEFFLAEGIDYPTLLPFLVFSPDKRQMQSLLPSLKTPHFLFPKLTQSLLQKGWWMHFRMTLYNRLEEKKRTLPNCSLMTIRV